jgi:hypothetical protein
VVHFVENPLAFIVHVFAFRNWEAVPGVRIDILGERGLG